MTTISSHLSDIECCLRNGLSLFTKNLVKNGQKEIAGNLRVKEANFGKHFLCAWRLDAQNSK